MAQLKARRIKKTYLALVQGSVTRGGRTDRGAHRPRPEAPHADGGRRPTVGRRDRLPGARALRRLDAARARPGDRPDAPDPRPSRRHRPSRRRRPGLRHRDSRGADPRVSDRLFLHAWRLELDAPSDGHLIRATAPLPAELETVLDVCAPRRRPMTDGTRDLPLEEPADISATRDDPMASSTAHRGRCSSSSRGRRGGQGHDHRRDPPPRTGDRPSATTW